MPTDSHPHGCTRHPAEPTAARLDGPAFATDPMCLACTVAQAPFVRLLSEAAYDRLWDWLEEVAPGDRDRLRLASRIERDAARVAAEIQRDYAGWCGAEGVCA